jgi:beta-lactamase regulating signal transducer with metallopeptidase domain
MHFVWQDSLWHLAVKGAALLTLALICGRALRRLSASRRYTLWVVASAVVVALPLSLLLPAWRVLPPLEPPTRPALLVEERSEVLAPSAMASTTPAPPKSAHANPVPQFTSGPPATQATPAGAHKLRLTWNSLIPFLPWLWVCGMLVLIGRIALSAWKLHRLRGTCTTASACDTQRAIAAELGLQKLPVTLVGACDAVPMVWGLWRPHLLLPDGFQQWPDGRLRSVLLHELAHLKRRDPLVLLLGQFMQALHWFNPLSWLTLRCLRADQERSCDDAVLRHGIRASDYAQHLLDLSRHKPAAPGLSLCALAMAKAAQVEARVSAILEPGRRRDPANRKWCGGVLALMVTVAAPLAVLQALEGPKPRGRILDRNGVVLAESHAEDTRRYPLMGLAAHLIGYVGRSAPDSATPHAWVGRAGMEKQGEATLAAGNDVVLTLDARIQHIAHRALSETGHSRGAVAIVDPRTGEILALVSLPSFDPGTFIPRISPKHFEELKEDTEWPLLDRSLSAKTPGAAFLPVTALAGISAGKATARFECTGAYKSGGRSFRCWIAERGGAHGHLSMQEAITHSCHCYWYQMAEAVGIDQIGLTCEQLGLEEAGIAARRIQQQCPNSSCRIRQGKPEVDFH